MIFRFQKPIIAVFFSFLVVFIFLAYVYFVGAPMTKAKNTLNQAIRAYQENNIENALILVEESINIWETSSAKFFKQSLVDNYN